MDPGFRTPLIDFFRRGEVARDVRLLAAGGVLAPRAHEQVALLILLADDPDPAVASSAGATLDALPLEALRSFLARSDVPSQMREFFAARGVEPALAAAADAARPLVDAAATGTGADPGREQEDGADDNGEGKEGTEEDEQQAQPLSSLPIVERMKLAMKGSKTQRSQLIRDSNKLVAAAVLSSPKLTDSEVEAFAKMANVTEEVLRTIAMNRAWVKNYGVIAGLTRNPKTPPAISMQMVQRLNDRDLKMLATDRNVPEAVRLAARKFVVKGPK
jgi:hypothetical protein